MLSPKRASRRCAAAPLGVKKRNVDKCNHRNYFVAMKTTLVRIGNSRGIRLPKPVIEQCGFTDEVDMEVNHHQLIIRPLVLPRSGWDAAFAKMSECQDDEILDRVAESSSTWDEEDWKW